MFAIIQYPYYEIKISIWFDYTIPNQNHDSLSTNNTIIEYTQDGVDKTIQRLADIYEALKAIPNARMRYTVKKINEPAPSTDEYILDSIDL